MQDDPFPAAERILCDIEAIFKKDPKLKEFDIVPVTVNQNKSPVLHVEHCLGLESWCVRHVYCYTYHRLMDIRHLRSRREDPATISRLLSGALLLNPDVSTFWNMKREMIQTGRLDIQGELHFTAVLLSRKPKCAEAFAHRKWIVGRLISAGLDAGEMLQEELRISEYAADRYPNNYHAWSHRIWSLTHLANSTADGLQHFLSEWSVSETWVSSHVSDHSGMQYRQFLLGHLLKHAASVWNKDMEENARKSLHQFLSSSEAIVEPSNGNQGNSNEITMGEKSTSVSNKEKFLKSLVPMFYNTVIDKCRNLPLIKSLGLICSELLLNIDLIQRFAGHEALWCHQRFLLVTLKSFLNSNLIHHDKTEGVSNEVGVRNTDISKGIYTNSFKLGFKDRYMLISDKNKPILATGDSLHLLSCNDGITSHLDDCHMNTEGVPLVKDQKLDSDVIAAGSLFTLLHEALIFHERRLISNFRSDEYHQQRLAERHHKWLSQTLKFEV